MFNFKEKSTIIKPLSSWNRMLMSGRSPHLNVHFNNELNWKTNGEGKFKKKKKGNEWTAFYVIVGFTVSKT